MTLCDSCFDRFSRWQNRFNFSISFVEHFVSPNKLTKKDERGGEGKRGRHKEIEVR